MAESTIKFPFGKGKVYEFMYFEIVSEIDAFMIYPRTSSLLDKEIKEVKSNNLPHLKYRCNEETCDFNSVLSRIRTCTDLKSKGVKDEYHIDFLKHVFCLIRFYLIFPQLH